MLSLLLIASLILTAGLINFLKFTIQSFYNRIRELGLRKCLGSSYSELFRMLSCEVLLILLLSFLLTLAFSESIIPYLYHYLPLSYQNGIGNLYIRIVAMYDYCCNIRYQNTIHQHPAKHFR